MLKRLKNIEDKTDNLDNISAVSASNLKKIDFYNPQSTKSRKLTSEINTIIDEIKKIKTTTEDKITGKIKHAPKLLLIIVQVEILIILTNTQT